MQETPRLLFVHAHPDDETITNGVTIAHYVRRGAQVQVLTRTPGEEGEVIGDQWAQLAVDHADQLGGYRIGELTAALHALGVSGPTYLGGPGRWRDSGMVGAEARRRQRFADADQHEAVGALVAIIRELRPHVVVTYDPNGGYGHPDHIQTHVVTTAAVGAAGTEEYPGTPWSVPKLYWTVIARSAFTAGWGGAGPRGLLRRRGNSSGRRRLRQARLRRRRDRCRDRRSGCLAGQDGGPAGARYAAHRRTHRKGARAVEQPCPADRRAGALHTGRRRSRGSQ